MPSNKKLLQAAAGNAGESLYVEDVFSTYLYEGNGSTQTITNGIDLDGEGGLVWKKQREAVSGGFSHNVLADTERGAANAIFSDLTDPQYSLNPITSFNSDGFSVTDNNSAGLNLSGKKYASWTFRKAEKFFDVVTYTGDGNAATQISHSLNSTPGVIIVKKTSAAGNWSVYHSYLGTGNYLRLEKYFGDTTDADYFPEVTDSYFRPGSDNHINESGQSFVAYLFASDAGGFGDDGDENIIKCGSYTGTGGFLDVNVGFEPQFVIVKSADFGNSDTDWFIIDTMRGFTFNPNTNYEFQALRANENTAEAAQGRCGLTSTGFLAGAGDATGASGRNYIYIAIRRPMKTPESGTEVFSPVAYSGNGAGQRTIDLDLTLDMLVTKGRNATIENIMYNRLSGTNKRLVTSSSANEASSSTNVLKSLDQEGITIGSDVDINGGSYTYIAWAFKRAKGFFDTVMYTGNGVAGNTITHNLGVVPELIITKSRSLFFGGPWRAFSAYLNGETNPWEYELDLASTSSEASSERMNNTAPTSTVFSLNDNSLVNANNYTYVAHLFASVEGVSKVGTYTGTGNTGTNVIDCGFSAGARFVLIKKVSGSGNWYCFDTARGITDGNAGISLQWNRANAEVSNSGNVNIDPNASGFEFAGDISYNYLNTLNERYIFLAIA